MALCDTQHAGKEIVTRPMSEYFANDPDCHDLFPSALRSHRVAGLRDVPQGRLWVESRPRRLRPCAVLWPCAFCSDRAVTSHVPVAALGSKSDRGSQADWLSLTQKLKIALNHVYYTLVIRYAAIVTEVKPSNT